MILRSTPFHRITTIFSSTPHECSGAAINHVSFQIATIDKSLLAFFSLATISASHHESGNADIIWHRKWHRGTGVSPS